MVSASALMQAKALAHLFPALRNATIPPLDPWLDQVQQSVVVEAIFWCVTYALYANVFAIVFRVVFCQYPFWDDIKKRSGTFTENAQDDLIVVSVLALHHCFGGGLMLAGSFAGNSDWWRHGLLVEIGFELHDVVSLFFGTFPYTEFLKPEIKVVMIFHHIPGISLALPILSSALRDNPHLHLIGGSLLFAGGVTLLLGSFTHTRDFKTQMKQAALAQVFIAASYIYARFIIFPIEMYGLYEDLIKDDYDPLIRNGVLAGGVFMSIFNLVLLPDIVGKAFRYVKKAFMNISVELEKGPVPLSKEDRWAEEEQATKKKKT